MSCCFPQSARLKTRRQYQRIAQRPVRHVGKWIVIDSRKVSVDTIKLGITASRHYGIAVQRNRFKRIVREAFRICRYSLQQGLEINVKPRMAARTARSTDVMDELLAFLADGFHSKS